MMNTHFSRGLFLGRVVIVVGAIVMFLWLKPGGAISAGKTLSIAVPCNANTFDIINQPLHDAMLFSQLIFENLVEVDQDGEIKPMLAKALPKVSNDRLTYWFDLRDDVYFQNGQKFTAEDVKYSYEYVLDPAHKVYRRTMWTFIRSIVVESPTRVRFEMHTPFRPWLYYMTKYMSIFPKGSREKYGDAFFKTGPEGMGTGPGIFVKAVQNDYVEYKRNPRYWRKGVPAWERLIVRTIPEDAVRVAYLMTNQAQIISAPSPQDYVRLKRMPGITGDDKPAAGGVLQLMLNNKRPPFDDVNFRKAVALAIDRKSIAEKVYYGLVTPVTLPAAPNAWWFNKQTDDLLKFNKDKAKEYLQKSKYPTGAEFEMNVPAQPYVVDSRDAALVIQSQLAEIGIKVNLRILEAPQAMQAVIKGDHVAALQPIMSVFDPIWQIQACFVPGEIVSKSSNYENPALTAAIKASFGVNEREELKPIFDKIFGILAEDSPHVWLGFIHIANLWRTEIEGFKVNSGLTMHVRDVILK